jgi:hypothetical protein
MELFSHDPKELQNLVSQLRSPQEPLSEVKEKSKRKVFISLSAKLGIYTDNG